MRVRSWLLLSLVSLILFSGIAILVNGGEHFNSSIHPYDVAIRQWVIAHSTPAVKNVALFFTYLANPEVVAAVFVFLLLLLFIVHEFQIIVFFLAGLVIGESTIRLFKVSFGRLRPEDLLSITQGGYAFPSGHAFAAAMFYGFVGHGVLHLCSKRWQKVVTIIGTTVVVVAIGMSRIILGVHWPTDVLAGWLLGIAFLTASIGIFHYFRRKNGHSNLIFKNKNKLRIGIIFVLLIAFIGYYYVTHPAELRSIGTSEVKQ